MFTLKLAHMSENKILKIKIENKGQLKIETLLCCKMSVVQDRGGGGYGVGERLAAAELFRLDNRWKWF